MGMRTSRSNGEGIVHVQGDRRAELCTFPVEHLPYPSGIRRGGAAELEVSDLHRDQPYLRGLVLRGL